MMLTIFIAFIGLISLMVIHEFGHFILAKRFGIRVDEFGIGYPPRIFGKKIGQTIYSLNLIPFGAFVKVHGEQGGDDDYYSFAARPIWQRILIVFGGVVSFWIVAIIVLSIVSGVWGLPTAVSDENNHNLLNPKVRVAAISSSSPAKESGLMLGDTILGFEKVKEVQEFIEANKGKEIVLIIKRGKETLEKKIVPRVVHPQDQGPLGIALVRIALVASPWYLAPVEGIKTTWQITTSVLNGWIMALKAGLGLDKLPEGVAMDLMGPLGIFDLLGEYFAMGINYFLFLISLIAVALALTNLLPIPALDGGKLIFLAMEIARGKPISHKLEQRISSVFFALLILLMVFVTVKFDIPRIF